jgi:hypothetical protein
MGGRRDAKAAGRTCRDLAEQRTIWFGNSGQNKTLENRSWGGNTIWLRQEQGSICRAQGIFVLDLRKLCIEIEIEIEIVIEIDFWQLSNFDSDFDFDWCRPISDGSP